MTTHPDNDDPPREPAFDLVQWLCLLWCTLGLAAVVAVCAYVMRGPR